MPLFQEPVQQPVCPLNLNYILFLHLFLELDTMCAWLMSHYVHVHVMRTYSRLFNSLIYAWCALSCRN